MLEGRPALICNLQITEPGEPLGQPTRLIDRARAGRRQAMAPRFCTRGPLSSAAGSRPAAQVRTSWTEVVTPGVLPTATARDRFRLLISELLPTLGSPTMPAQERSPQLLPRRSRPTAR